jgi:hypothetical protein
MIPIKTSEVGNRGASSGSKFNVNSRRALDSQLPRRSFPSRPRLRLRELQGKLPLESQGRILSGSRLARRLVALTALLTGERNARSTRSLEPSARARYKVCTHARVAARAKFFGSWPSVPRKVAGQKITRRLAETEEPVGILIGPFHLHAGCAACAPSPRAFRPIRLTGQILARVAETLGSIAIRIASAVGLVRPYARDAHDFAETACRRRFREPFLDNPMLIPKHV